MSQQLAPEDPRRAALVRQECGLYLAAAQDMKQAGQPVRADMLEGCTGPGLVTADLSRTVNRQATTRFPELIYQRMIARGVPKATADKISRSAAYWAVADAYQATFGS